MTQAVTDTLIGQYVLGGYKIQRQLGEGGMGAVYLGEDEILGKKVAVKVLLPECAQNQALLERFIQEARAAVAVRHPNIIDIIGFDRLPDGRHCFAMEFIDGVDLRAYCAYCMEQYGEVPLDRALEILSQIAAALDSVHRKQIVHRDLKPENIMVTSTDDKVAHVVVLDFGIAKLSEASLPNVVRTAGPMVIGTRGYWSPEQARGDHVDTRSDIFSVGVIAYEMFTGVLPQAPQADPRQHQRGRNLPALWAETILAALAFDPAQRPQTVREFIRPLIDAIEDGPELAALAAPSLFRSATTDDMTMKHGGKVPVAGAARTPPAPTTLRAGAGVRNGTPVPTRARRPWMLGAGLVCALGIGGGLLALSASSNKSDEQARITTQEENKHSPAAKAAVAAEPDAAAVSAKASEPPRKIQLRIESKPAGALVFIGEESKPRGDDHDRAGYSDRGARQARWP